MWNSFPMPHKEHSLLENSVLRTYMDIKRMKWREAGKMCIMRSSVVGTLQKILLAQSNRRGCKEWGMLHKWGNEKCVQNFCRKVWREETTHKTYMDVKRELNGFLGNRVWENELDLSGFGKGPVNTVMKKQYVRNFFTTICHVGTWGWGGSITPTHS